MAGYTRDWCRLPDPKVAAPGLPSRVVRSESRALAFVTNGTVPRHIACPVHGWRRRTPGNRPISIDASPDRLPHEHMECESCTHQTLLPAELAFLRTFASPIEVPTATTVGESVRGWPKVSLTQKRDPDLTPSAVFQSRRPEDEVRLTTSPPFKLHLSLPPPKPTREQRARSIKPIGRPRAAVIPR